MMAGFENRLTKLWWSTQEPLKRRIGRIESRLEKMAGESSTTASDCLEEEVAALHRIQDKITQAFADEGKKVTEVTNAGGL